MTTKDGGRQTLPPTPFIEKLSTKVNTLVEKVLLVIGSSICLILFAQVLCRYSGASLGWAEEVSRHLLVAITFLGSTAAYKRSGLLGMTGIGHWFGPCAERLIVLCIQLLTLCCFALICWFGAQYTAKAWHHTTAALQIPMALPFSVIPTAACILSLHVIANINKTVRLARQKP